jgi:hypothetical protein
MEHLITKDSLEIFKDNRDYFLNDSINLLGFNNSTKILKGFKEHKFTTGILYLQPSTFVAKKTLCPMAVVAGCDGPCLRGSGRLGMSQSQLAMTRRTIQYLKDPGGFKGRLRQEILKGERDDYCIRLNGTSDEDWSDLIESLPNIQFYDYSKVLKRILKNKIPNYHLTYSASFNNTRSINFIKEAVKSGVNTAIALNTKETKGEFKRPLHLVIDGVVHSPISMDRHDLRFLDPDGAIGTLVRKGSNKIQRGLDMMTPYNFFATPNLLGRLA